MPTYDKDFYQWTKEQAQLLRKRKLDLLDYDNLIEEIEDMGNSQKDALESNLRVLLIHLVKWQYQPQKRTNSWRSSIVEDSLRVNKLLKKNPSFKRYFDEIFEETYQDALKIASIETGIPKNKFPVECPFSKEYVLSAENIFTDLSEDDENNEQ